MKKETYVRRQTGDLRYTRTRLGAGSAHNLVEGGTIDVIEEMYAWTVHKWDILFNRSTPEWREIGISLEENPPEGTLTVIPERQCYDCKKSRAIDETCLCTAKKEEAAPLPVARLWDRHEMLVPIGYVVAGMGIGGLISAWAWPLL